MWYSSTIESILENEKYCGDLLLQKYFTVDFLSHKVEKNIGQLPQYFIEDDHEPIIPKEIFYQVQGEKQRRSLLRYSPNKIRFGSTQALVGRLICGHCGRTLKKYTSAAGIDWRCRQRAYVKQSVSKENPAACPCRIVPEKEVKGAIIKAFNQLPALRDKIVGKIGSLRNGVIKQIDATLDNMKEQKERMSQSVDNPVINDEIRRLEAEETRLLLERAEAANTEVRLRLLLELVSGK